MTTQFKYPNEKKRKPLSVRIPAWIKPVDDIAQAHHLDGDRLRVLLHQFFLCYLKNSKLRRAKAGSNFLPEYFPVSSVLLRQTCTDNYILYVNALIDEGVIEKRGHEGGKSSYIVGGHAQLYRWRIPDSFYGGCSFRKESVTGHKQIKSVLRTRDQHMKEYEQEALKLSKENPIYVELFNCLNDVVFDEAYQELATEATSDLRFLETEALANRDFNWFTVDVFGQRLHHPLTTMPKEYRKYLRFKDRPDERLVILDLKNSQPYMSSIIVNKDLIIEYLPAFVPMIEHICGYEKKADFLLYRRLCVEGRLYEFLMEGLGYNPKLDQASHKVRTQIKELFFSAVLFSRTGYYHQSDPGIIIQSDPPKLSTRLIA